MINESIYSYQVTYDANLMKFEYIIYLFLTRTCFDFRIIASRINDISMDICINTTITILIEVDSTLTLW